MTTGIMFPFYAEGVDWLQVSGAWSPDYPLTNLSDVIMPSNVARASSAGARTIVGRSPASLSVRSIALIGHNMPEGVSFRIRCFSGDGYDPQANASDLVLDTGATTSWRTGAPQEGYRSIRPEVFANGASVQSIRIDIGAFSSPLEIGAIEVAGFWEWPGVSYGREMGIKADGVQTDLVGGARLVEGETRARTITAQVDKMRMSVTSTTGLEFQSRADKQRPFVWSEDFADPAEWARKCMLVTNEELPPMVGALYRHDVMPVQMTEHMR